MKREDRTRQPRHDSSTMHKAKQRNGSEGIRKRVPILLKYGTKKNTKVIRS